MLSHSRSGASPGRRLAGGMSPKPVSTATPPGERSPNFRAGSGFSLVGAPQGRQASNPGRNRSPSAAGGNPRMRADQSRLPLRTLQSSSGQIGPSNSGIGSGSANAIRRSDTLTSIPKVIATGVSIRTGSSFSNAGTKPVPFNGNNLLLSPQDSSTTNASSPTTAGRTRTASMEPHGVQRNIKGSIPSLLDSVDSVHFLRQHQPSNEQSAGQQALLSIKQRIHLTPAPPGAASVPTSGISLSPAKSPSSANESDPRPMVDSGAASVNAALDIRLAEGQASALAAGRLIAANRKQRYSEGDRLSYQADRVDFHAHRSGVCYYALCAVGDGDEVVLHGGQYFAGGALGRDNATGDLFRWSKTTGCQRVTYINGSLPKLVGHTMVCHKGSRLFIYGGCGPQTTGLFSDLWVVNLRGAMCHAIATSTPQPPGRARHACATHGRMMYVHGGHCHRSGAKLLSDMWMLNMENATWTKLPTDTVNLSSLSFEEQQNDSYISGPGARYGHHMAVWRDWLYIALGSDGGQGFADLWAYSIEHQYWNKVNPKERPPEVRIDCAATIFGNKWLFHGGLDAQGNFLNCFYEFNFDTHEGRQIRVELAVTPVKILPALMGHAMATIQGAPDDSGVMKNRVLIFGGINRQRTVVHVIYCMRDTGRSPGTLTEPVRWPAWVPKLLVPPSHQTHPSVTSEQASSEHVDRPSSPAAWLIRDHSGSNSDEEPPQREPEPDLVSASVSQGANTNSRTEQEELRRQLRVAELTEVEELRRENEELRTRLAALTAEGLVNDANSSGLSLFRERLPPKQAVLELMVKTEEAFGTVRQLGETWSQLYRALDL